MAIPLYLSVVMATLTTQQLFAQDAIDLLLNAGLIAKIVLGVLFIFSVISWGIILDKIRVFRRLDKETERFMQLFRKRKSVREIFQASREYPSNPFASVFKEAYWVFTDPNHAAAAQEGRPLEMLREKLDIENHSSTDLIRVFDSAASREVLRLEKYLPFLATTGSVSPFFGLFGTVWGVMTAFLAIGMTGSADLSVVAPGIAEALITTIAGLGAAIPAVIAYNFFVSKLRRLSAELEIFYSNLIDAFARKESHEVR